MSTVEELRVLKDLDLTPLCEAWEQYPAHPATVALRCRRCGTAQFTCQPCLDGRVAEVERGIRSGRGSWYGCTVCDAADRYVECLVDVVAL